MLKYQGQQLNLNPRGTITDKDGEEYGLFASMQPNPVNPKQSVDSFFLFTKTNTRYVGCITFKSITDNHTHIVTFSINPSYQQKGLGTALLKHTLKYLQSCNNDKITLLASFGVMKNVTVQDELGDNMDVSISNNVLFYKRFGFGLNYNGILKRMAIVEATQGQLNEADMQLLSLQKVDVARLPKSITLLTEQQTLDLSPDTIYDQALYYYISGKLHM